MTDGVTDAPPSASPGNGDGCDLCALPTPEPPVTGPDVVGTYCCRGCLAVAGSLDDPVGTDPGTARERVGSDDATVPGGAETAFVRVDGMHCTSCEAFLESRAERADAVHRASASYASELVRVDYDADALDEDDGEPGGADRAVLDLLDAPGYTARPADEPPDDSESLGRLLVGGFVGMMVMLWYVLFLYPAYLGVPTEDLLFDLRSSAGRYLLWNVWAFATLVLGYTGAPVLRGAYVSLRARRPNMDLLVATAATTAYAYSTLVLLTGGIDVYFDVSVVVLVAVTVGSHYERRRRRRAAGRLTDLTGERVAEAERVVPTADRSGEVSTETVPVKSLSAGDEVVVGPGERVPTDGTVVAGRAGVDESLVTGEAAPRRVEPDDEVVGGSLATDGELRVRSTGESTVDRLTHHLWDVQAATPGAQRLADRVAAVFVPLVVLVAVAAFGATLLLGGSPTGALLTALAVLVVSCPCAMGLATPLAVAAGVRDALDRGVVVTDPSVFETAVTADVVAFDKTGTLTEDAMSLVEWTGDREAMRRAAAVETRADHPVAAAVTDAFDRPEDASTAGFRTHPGQGVSAVVDGDRVYVGDRVLFDSLDGEWSVPPECRTLVEGDSGSLTAYIGWDGTVRAALVAAERPREGWAAAVSALADEGRRVVVLSGDEGAALAPFADHPAVDEVFAGVPPEGKAETVERLRAEGTVAMVGDGSNDAPALAAADLGVALRTGTELAADAADAVVTDGDLRRVTDVFALTRGTRRRVRENLGWALCYNAVAVPAAALGFVSPLLAAVAMAASSLLVVTNSTRAVLDGEGSGDGGPGNGAGVPAASPDGVAGQRPADD